MERFFRYVSTAFLLLVILLATELGPVVVVKGKSCEFPSSMPDNWCLISGPCNVLCQDNEFDGGECQGFLFGRCICTKEC
ncbi:hypothetical protein GQ457_05G016600 [Hibiscus cannabinus]